LLLDKNRLTIPDLGGYPATNIKLTSAILEERRKFGREFLWLGIMLFLVAGLGVIFIVLYYYVKTKMLIITTEEGREMEVKGTRETLDDLHYMVQRHCLKERKKEKRKGKKYSASKMHHSSKHGFSEREKKTFASDDEGITALTCPQCGSHDLYYEAALHTGRKYHCKRCDYIGAFIIEEKLRP